MFGQLNSNYGYFCGSEKMFCPSIPLSFTFLVLSAYFNTGGLYGTDRVIDEMNPDNHFSRGQLENLLKNEVHTCAMSSLFSLFVYALDMSKGS